MKYMVIKGNVKGGHHIKDLGVHVPFGEEVLIPVQRAGYSRDLSHALKSKSVVRAGSRDLSPSPLPPTARKKPLAKPVTKAPRKTPPPPPSPEQVERDELRRMNRELMDKLSKLTESQQKLMDRLGEAVDRGGLQAPDSVGRRSTYRHAPPEDVWLEDDELEEDEAPVVFIPSKIRSDKTKVSDNNSVKEETKDASEKMDAAAQALAAMKKGRKRRSKKDGDDS